MRAFVLDGYGAIADHARAGRARGKVVLKVR
jgi:hypothetical protein